MKLKILLLSLLFSTSVAVNAQSTSGFTTGNTPTQQTEFSISPNPGTNELNIRLTKKKTANVEVYNLLGKKVFSGKLNAMSSTIDITKWKSGIYLVKVVTDSKSITKRFVKK